MKHRSFRRLALAVSGICAMLGASVSHADDAVERPKLYCVGYSHLDTQWRWSYPQVISEFLHNTLQDNFKLFDKYPHYIFNFTGANRYMLFKEYYPADYEKLKKCIADGRWFPAGSSMEEGDVNMPDGEALIRQVLYGNEFFHKEFGKQSTEYMLPDCFGFQASLPSILAHCGLKGFSTQKLTWGSAVGIPFNVGIWDGPDGHSIIAALNPTSYGSEIEPNLASNPDWIKRMKADTDKTGVSIDYRYYGTGDRGGAPGEKSIANLEKNLDPKAPIELVSATADQMFNDLTPEQIAKLPHYKGDLLLTGHSTGELSSEAFIKRCERKIENLADAAEHASVIANWLGGAEYPIEKINAAWRKALGNQFHDTMAGTALPRAYDYAWNDEFISLNEFAAVAQDGVGAIIRALDTTSTDGIPLVIYNPLTIDRQDVTEATVTLPDNFKDAISITDADGKPVPFQILSREGNQAHLLLLAKAPSVGFSVYQIKPAADESRATDLKVTDNSLENARFKVTINSDGDISSIVDKASGRETLTAPARLEFLYQNPEQWPAWNMDYADRSRKPDAYVSGPAKIKIIENGPARVAIEVERQAMGSTIRQQIRLTSGGDRVEVALSADWATQQHSLEAVFPLVAGNPTATYESQTAAIQRGNNNPKKFEVPQQQWLDLTDSTGGFGTSILNDCKYGSDKPDDHTIRLTLIYTPGTRAGYQDQGSQDLGHHEMVYAIAPHSDGWQQAGTAAQARRLNQPLLAFQSPAHPGTLGKSFSFVNIGSDHVTATAIKKAEDSDEIIVRLHEVNGQAANGVALSFATPIVSAREVDGQEREIGKTAITDGKLQVDLTPFALRAFAVKLAPPASPLTAPVSQPVQLAYDLSAVTSHEHMNSGAFDTEGHSYAGEAFPAKIVSEGITFNLGSAADGEKNAVVCKGQSIALPANTNRVYLLAAALGGDTTGTFKIDDQPHALTVADWSSPIGAWDTRLWQGVVLGLTYDWTNRLAGLKPGFSKHDEVAWCSSHRHDAERGNEYYVYTYLFKYALDVPAGAKQLTLPDNANIRIFAVSAASNVNDDSQPAGPLYDTLKDRGHTAGATFSPEAGTFKDSTFVTLHPPLYWKDRNLHYTTDGSEPTADSPVYTKPILISQKTTLKSKEIDDTGSSETSSTVIDVNDVTPPTVKEVSGISTVPSLTVRFSEPVDKEQAENVANYRITPELKIASVELSDEGTVATLKLAAPAEGSNYQIALTGISDLSPNANKVSSEPIAVKLPRPAYVLDSFVAAGKGLEVRPNDLPVKAGDSWTINLFVRPTAPLEDLTLIAGFGKNTDDDGDGHGRYLAKFQDGLHFWSRNADASSRANVRNKRWQMISATYDGSQLVIYQNGKAVGGEKLQLSDDEPVVEIAPLDPWDHARRFTGEIRDMSIWSGALTPEAIATLTAKMPK